jgi:hypothetical protein
MRYCSRLTRYIVLIWASVESSASDVHVPRTVDGRCSSSTMRCLEFNCIAGNKEGTCRLRCVHQ